MWRVCVRLQEQVRRWKQRETATEVEVCQDNRTNEISSDTKEGTPSSCQWTSLHNTVALSVNFNLSMIERFSWLAFSLWYKNDFPLFCSKRCKQVLRQALVSIVLVYCYRSVEQLKTSVSKLWVLDRSAKITTRFTCSKKTSQLTRCGCRALTGKRDHPSTRFIHRYVTVWPCPLAFRSYNLIIC